MTDEYLQRFSGLGRLYGNTALQKLHDSHVCIVGVGGVGSWIVEALARSGIGTLTLVDLDDVCITNTNRQLPALTSTVGQPKISVLSARAREINPECRIFEVPAFVSESNCDSILPNDADVLIDAVDRMSIKAAIIAWAHCNRVPIITCGSAGGRIDSLAIKCADLGMTGHDPLLQQVRKKLRQDHGYPKSTDGRALPLDVIAVYSTEHPRFPLPDGTCSLEKPTGQEAGIRLDCSAGFGAATHVTGAFGFAAAAEVLKKLVGTT